MMNRLLLILLLTGLLWTGCGAAKRARVEKSRQLHALTIDDFHSFLGVKKHYTYDSAINVWGEPGKEETNEGSKINYGSMYYFGEYGERLFSLTYDKRNYTLNYIRVTGSNEISYKSTRDFFKKCGVNDIKLQFLGMPRDSIVSVFGEPTRTQKSELEYQKGGITVTFLCPEFSGGFCDEILVFWNYYYKKQD
ncbi:MAG: hypothetical protein ACO1PI_04405 [Bacteroidota bacterium]